MSEVDEKVMSAVEEALAKNPDATVDELFAIAKDVSAGVAGLTKRQFHARYPLQIKRRLSPPRPRRPARKKAGRKPALRADHPSAREAVRSCFLKFASDLAAADAPKDLIRVVAGLDRYVDEVMKAVGKS